MRIEKPYEPYGNDMAELLKGKGEAFSYDDPQIRECYNKTWELDHRCAMAVITSRLWGISDPFTPNWAATFKDIIPRDHFGDWPLPKTNAEIQVLAQRLHYPCNMLCMAVDWKHHPQFLGVVDWERHPPLLALMGYLNHAEVRIVTYHGQRKMSLVNAFRKALDDWINAI